MAHGSQREKHSRSRDIETELTDAQPGLFRTLFTLLTKSYVCKSSEWWGGGV